MMNRIWTKLRTLWNRRPWRKPPVRRRGITAEQAAAEIARVIQEARKEYERDWLAQWGRIQARIKERDGEDAARSPLRDYPKD